jgi:hypothetical protein
LGSSLRPPHFLDLLLLGAGGGGSSSTANTFLQAPAGSHAAAGNFFVSNHQARAAYQGTGTSLQAIPKGGLVQPAEYTLTRNCRTCSRAELIDTCVQMVTKHIYPAHLLLCHARSTPRPLSTCCHVAASVL